MAWRNNFQIVVVFSIICVVCCEYCSYNNKVKYCSTDCCDDDCCDDWTTAMIVGAVIGGLTLLASIIGCAICIYCMCKKKKQHNVQPYQNSNTIYIHNAPGPYGGGGYNHYRPQVNPPPYNQASSYPSAQSQDPAYPPGSVDHPPPAYTYRDPNKK